LSARGLAIATFAVAIALQAGSATAQADAAAATRPEPRTSRTPTPFLDTQAPDLERSWQEAEAIEAKIFDDETEPSLDLVASHLRAGELFESVAHDTIRFPNAYWRASRSYWMAGERLPVEDTDTRVPRFLRARDLAQKGIEANPECAECMLWKFIAMGRLGTSVGVRNMMGSVSEMAELLDTAIELNPTYRDGKHNSTLGNLHYSSAIFYRVLPEWFWLRWVLGVRGDKERALEHIRQALVIHPKRLDYKVELGAQLLCLGSGKREETRLIEGRAVMNSAIASEDEFGIDNEREILAAKIMLEEPKKSCGYTGDTWVEIEDGDLGG
jgi:tetratricopeptide (TPR) repeat protein